MSAALVHTPRVAAVIAAAAHFEVADSAALERMALQRRFDRKFLLGAEHAPAVVGALDRDYHVVLARDERLALYDTMYFDTPSLRCYHDHRRGRRPRFKVRIRNYLDRELSMLEFKEKTAQGDTHKARWKRETMCTELTPGDLAHLAEARPGIFSEGGLVPQARTVFRRLMLLNTRSVERATLDFDLSVGRGSEPVSLAGVVVVEVKDVGRGTSSPLIAALRRYNARALPFSKYCVAIASVGNERSNSFLPSLRYLESRA